MPRARASALILGGVLLLSAASCEGQAPLLVAVDRAGTAGRRANGPGGEGGNAGEVSLGPGGAGAREQAGATAAGSGGTGAQNGRGGTRASGGTNTMHVVTAGTGGTHAGGQSGHGGTQSDMGGTGGGELAGAGGAAPVDQLSLCLRLGDIQGATQQDLLVTLDYEDAFVADCRVNWVFYLYFDPAQNLDQRQDFLNQLLHFNFELWGCFDSPPPDSFDLIYTPHPLTRADADALIEAYLGVAKRDLSMGADEVSEMRALLRRLSEPLLVSPDPGGFSAPNCAVHTGAGGEGGDGGGAGQAGQESGGQPSGGRPSGGQPSSGQAGTGHAGTG
jgi:hypothetical protein